MILSAFTVGIVKDITRFLITPDTYKVTVFHTACGIVQDMNHMSIKYIQTFCPYCEGEVWIPKLIGMCVNCKHCHYGWIT